MIARHWKGIAKVEEADHYIQHLKKDTFPKLSTISGFIQASILQRKVESGIEFLIITHWESMEAIQHFAGKTAHIAVVPPVAQAMMVTYDKEVIHYEVADTYPR